MSEKVLLKNPKVFVGLFLSLIPFICFFVLGIMFIEESFVFAMTFPLVGLTVSLTLIPIISKTVVGYEIG